MSDEIGQRMAAAAQAAREHDLCAQHAQLKARERAAAADLDAARQEYAGDEKDAERLVRDEWLNHVLPGKIINWKCLAFQSSERQKRQTFL
jgi:hypothetical protein